MSDGKVIIDTQLNDKGLTTGVNKIKGSFTGIGSIAKTGLAVAGKALAATTAAVVGLGTAVVKTGASYEAQMSKVKAISGATTEQMDKLSKKALEMGNKTKFSATEAGEAYEYMAMAGWKTKDMLNGIEGIMNLAAASGEDLAATSDIVTDALTAFGLSAKDSTRFADVLATTSANANTNVSLMGETFKYVAPVAGALGYSIEDTAVAIGLMGNAGIKASSAGTSLRAMLMKLAKPSKTVAVAMKDLGISLTDSSGKMRPLNVLLTDMRKKFANLTEEQKAQYAASLAGKTGMSGLLAIVNASDKDFNKLTESINNSTGAAEEMASEMQNNLSGQIEILKGQLSTLGVEIYQALNKNGGLTGMVKVAEGYVKTLADAFHKNGVDGMVQALNDILTDLLGRISEAAPKLIDFCVGILGMIATVLVENSNVIFEAIIQIVESVGSVIADNSQGIVDGLTIMLTNAINMLADNIPNLIPIILALVEGLAVGLIENYPKLEFAFANLIVKAIAGLIKSVPNMAGVALAIIQSLGSSFIKNASKLGQFVKDMIAKAFGASAANEASKFFDKVKDTATKAFKAIKDIATTVMNAVKTIWQALEPFFRVLFNGVKSLATEVWNSIKTVITNAWSSIKSVWNSALPTFQQIFTSIKTVVSTVFNTIKTIAQNTVSKVKAIWKVVGPYFTTIFNGILAVAKSVIPLIKSPFQKALTTVKTVWNVAKTYFTGIFNAIKNIFSSIQSVWTGDFKGAWNSIKKVFTGAGSTFIGIGKNIMNGIKEGINNKIKSVKNAVSGVAKSIGDTFKNILGIHSPSKVMKQLGEYTMQGLEVGISARSSRVVNVAKKTASQVISALEDSLDKSQQKLKSLQDQEAKDFKSYQSTLAKLAELQNKNISKMTDKQLAAHKEKIKKYEKESEKLSKKLDKESKKITKLQIKIDVNDEALKKVTDDVREFSSVFDELTKGQSMMDSYKEYISSMQKSADDLTETYKTTYESVKAGWQQSLDEMKSDYESVIKDIQKSRDDLYKSTLNFTGLFDEVKKEDTIDANTILANAKAQTDKVELFYNDLAKLKQMNLPDEIVEQFKNMGVDAAEQLEVFVNMSQEQVDEFVASWQQRSEIAKKTAEEFYAGQEEALTEGYEKQKALIESQMNDELSSLTELYLSAMSDIQESIKEYNKGIANEIATALVASGQYSAKEAQKMGKTIADSLTSGLKDSVKESKKEAKQSGQELSKSVADGIKETSNTAVSATNDSFKQISSSTKSGMNNIASSISSGMKSNISAYESAMNTFKSKASSYATDIANAIKSAMETAMQVTETEAEDMTKGLTLGIVDATKDQLEIHSPSKVFAKLGDYCVQGFEQAFKNYNPTDVMKPSINETLTDTKMASMQKSSMTTNITNQTPVELNIYDSEASPDQIYRKFNNTMRYGLVGGLA